MVDSALTHCSTDRRKIAGEETGLPFAAHTAFAFDYEPAHALNQMPREIDPGVALLARVVGVEAAENELGGYRKRTSRWVSRISSAIRGMTALRAN